MTQGASQDDLKDHLIDSYRDLSSGAIPAARRHSELGYLRPSGYAAGSSPGTMTIQETPNLSATMPKQGE
jgi:hypothetical protein